MRRLVRAVAGHEVVAIYTTDSPVANRFAKAVHTEFGGSLIPYDRLSRSADDFAGLLFHNAVEYEAQQHPGQAVLVVAEAELTLPFLRRTTGQGAAGIDRADAEAGGFVIAISSDGTRSVARLPY